MDNNQLQVIQQQAEIVVANLKRNNMWAVYVPTASEAVEQVRELLSALHRSALTPPARPE